MTKKRNPWWGKRLREIRHEQGRTLEDVGAKAGMSRHYLSTIETGRHIPKIDTLENIAKALGGNIYIVGSATKARRQKSSVVGRLLQDQTADSNQ
jgi:transcriptional regulator with XRE-family HTH domain